MSNHKKLLISIGFKIRRERMNLGYSQQALAEKAGLHRTYIGIVERGEKNITISSCFKIATALEINLNDLICPAEI